MMEGIFGFGIQRRAVPRRMLVFVTLAAALSVAAPSSSDAQIGGLINRAKAKAKEKMDALSDSAADLGVDKSTGAVKCLASNVACIKKTFDAGKNVKVVDAQGDPVSAADSATAVNAAGGVPSSMVAASESEPAKNAASSSTAESAGSAESAPAAPVAMINYDFVPGDKVLFSEDFANDKVGDIPSRVKLLSGNFEIADFMGQRFLRSTSGGKIMIPLAAPLPQKFTLELDLIHSWGWDTEVKFVDEEHSDGHNYASFGSTGGIGDFSSAAATDRSNKVYHARMMVDGEHAKVYIDGKRVANVPEAKLGRANGIWIVGTGNDDEPFYVTNIRVAASDKSLFDALSASGRVSTHGILFDTNSDAIRPESAPTLQEIGDMLKQHADLKLTIEGHTDNVGNAAANQSLSERRAAAVRQALVSKYQIDGARLTSKGFGATKPAASNDTPEGRQQNRRVELVKM